MHNEKDQQKGCKRMAEQAKENVFRQKALERIASPEQLSSYLKVTSFSIWATLAAVILLLAGLFVWGSIGSLETVTDGVAVVSGGTAQIMVTDTSKGEVRSGMTVRLVGTDYVISATDTDDYGRITAYAPVSEPDGRYDVQIVVERISPITFLLD